MPSTDTDSTWMKNHPLEGDDVITGFYNVLAKRNPKTMKPCHDILVPDTVVFEHNFPRGWYTSDVKAREVTRKQGKELDACTIERGFVDGVPESCPTVATYLCTVEEEEEEGAGAGASEEAEERVPRLGATRDNADGRRRTVVEVFNTSTVAAFLSRKVKREGILQKFIVPKGYYNSVLQAVWSPRICMVHRRTNKYHIHDKKRGECDPFSSLVTYEGPTHLSEERGVSSHVAEAVKRACGRMVQHFYYTEHKFITRMVAYFKTDTHDRLWFLWCGSLRVSDRTAPPEVPPVRLVTNFCEPDDRHSAREEKVLRHADRAYLAATKDEMFYETYMKKHRAPVAAQAGKRGPHGQPAPALPHALPRQQDTSHGGETGSTFDWSATPAASVQKAHSRCLHEREELVWAMEDVLYRMRAQRMHPVPQTCRVELAPPVTAALAPAAVDELMATIHMRRVEDGGAESGSGTVAFAYSGPPNAPLTKMRDDAMRWIDVHYASKLTELQDGPVTARNEDACAHK